MVMETSMSAPEPKPEPLTLARLTLVFSGSLTDPRAGFSVDVFAQQITRVLKERHLIYAFPLKGENLVVGEFHVAIEGLESGSIRAKLVLIGNILLGAYGGVAAYPSFKEAIPVIQADIEYVLDEAAKHFATEYPQESTKFEGAKVALFREEDLEAELNRLRRRP